MTPLHNPLQPAAIIHWALNIATNMGTWLVARSLNMPQPLVHSTSAYVYTRVAAAETRAAKTLCPIALARRLRAWFGDLTA